MIPISFKRILSTTTEITREDRDDKEEETVSEAFAKPNAMHKTPPLHI